MNGLIALAAALAIAVAAFGSAIAQGLVGSKAMEGMAKQPEAAGMLRTNMILALAFIESLSIYGLLIAFLLYAKV